MVTSSNANGQLSREIAQLIKRFSGIIHTETRPKETKNEIDS